MKFIYLGCEGAPDVSIHYGVEFEIGQPAEVSDAHAISKLTRHPHFALQGESIEADEERASVVAQAQARGIRIGRKSVDTLKREIAETQGAGDANQD